MFPELKVKTLPGRWVFIRDLMKDKVSLILVSFRDHGYVSENDSIISGFQLIFLYLVDESII